MSEAQNSRDLIDSLRARRGDREHRLNRQRAAVGLAPVSLTPDQPAAQGSPPAVSAEEFARATREFREAVETMSTLTARARSEPGGSEVSDPDLARRLTLIHNAALNAGRSLQLSDDERGQLRSLLEDRDSLNAEDVERARRLVGRMDPSYGRARAQIATIQRRVAVLLDSLAPPEQEADDEDLDFSDEDADVYEDLGISDGEPDAADAQRPDASSSSEQQRTN